MKSALLVASFSLLLSGFLFGLQTTTAQAQMPSFTGSIVPCGSATTCTDGARAIRECGFCDLVALAQNIINFLIFAGIVIAVLMFVYAGILYVTSPGNSGNISKAHSIFWDVLVGLIITLAAWLIVDVIMKTFYNQDYGPWNAIVCGVGSTAGSPNSSSCPCAGGGSCKRIELTQDELSVPDLNLAELPGRIGDTGGETSVTNCEGGASFETLPSSAPSAYCTSVLCDRDDATGGLRERQVCVANEIECTRAAQHNRGTFGSPSDCTQNPAAAPAPEQCTNCREGLTCNGCEPTDPSIPLRDQNRICADQSSRSGACYIAPGANDGLAALAARRGSDWYVSEAWPPTIRHVSDCHSQGTCVDAMVRGDTSVQNLASFAQDAKDTGARRTVFESTDQAKVNALKAQGQEAIYLPNCNTGQRPCLTGDHFSVYY